MWPEMFAFPSNLSARVAISVQCSIAEVYAPAITPVFAVVSCSFRFYCTSIWVGAINNLRHTLWANLLLYIQFYSRYMPLFFSSEIPSNILAAGHLPSKNLPSYYSPRHFRDNSKIHMERRLVLGIRTLKLPPAGGGSLL